MVVVAGLGPVRVNVKSPSGCPPTVTVPESVQFVVQLGTATFSVKDWVAFAPIPLLAVKLIGNVPEADGVPLSVPVPLWLSVNRMPPGSAPISCKAGVGIPVAVTVKEPAIPEVKLAAFALVMAGA